VRDRGDLGQEQRARGLDLRETSARMEVASALLEASKKISADSSTGTSCSATATWSSSISEENSVSLPPLSVTVLLNSFKEVNDKTGELPNSSAWMGGWGKRTRTCGDEGLKLGLTFVCVRAASESEGSATMSMGSWFSGMRERSGSSPGNQGWFGQPRVRRSSSKDVEEAMAGGLNKSEIFMPPM